MKKGILALLFLIILAACGNSEAQYNIVEEEEPGEKRIVVRITTDDTSEENINAIFDELYVDEYWGSHSIFARIHEPSEDEEFGPLVAIAKYARSSEGLAQIGEDELDKVYIEYE